MKNIRKQGIWTLLLLFILAACSPQEDDRYSLGELGTVTSEIISFSQTPSASSNNVITYENTSSLNFPVTAVWDLGNGSSARGNKVTASYPEKGDYTVTLTLYAADGSMASKSVVVHIEEDDFGLINTPAYTNLTGGADNLNGKTWVFDQYHDGHFGVGPADGNSPEWWSCPAQGKEGSSLYSQKFTFFQQGTKMKWENNGYIYTNAAGVQGMGNPSGVIANPGGVGDFDVPFVPNPEGYSFRLNEEDMTLELSGGAFFGFYTGTSIFKIYSLTETELYIKCVSTVEPSNAWWFRLIPEELNVAEPPVEKLPKAIPLSETFESGSLTVDFVKQDMGPLSGIVDNPAPVSINTSNKVYRYQKTTAFYSNLSFTAPDYKFDLTTQNKIRVKVYIPSYNDYETENAVAGDWITEKRLRPQLAVKLQNSDMGDNAWQTQTEIIKRDLTKDRWLELEFDFSSVSDRQDYDKIVIQFGGEGHAGQGLFFFDDFTFSE